MEAPLPMVETPEKPLKFRVADLPQNQKTPFELRPGKAELDKLAAGLDLLGLRKVALIGQISAYGKSDWQLIAHLGATVVQPCVVSLDPVTTRIEAEVERRFLADLPYVDEDAEEIEMPEDENAERLGAEIDISAILSEALALNLPLYPRADGAEIAEKVFTEPGKKAMTDEDARPFAGLAGLRDKLADEDEK
ncbi:DUF177 domain-containing protein [Shimia sp. SDUM112013]|uniref:YceD family protein n=1 Tax=Shimia sp. SDUM112013 TaxID=3136160 RepID=UPI0032EBE834